MISTRFATVLFTLLLATGCSDDATNDGQSQGGGSGGANNGSGAGSNNGGSNNGSGAGSNNGGSNNGGSNNGGSGGEPEVTFPVCLQQCDTPADCVIPGSTQYDEDNYACNDSYCEYLGCQNDGECQTLGAEWRCGGQALGLPICVRTCSNPSDCAQGADPDFLRKQQRNGSDRNRI